MDRNSLARTGKLPRIPYPEGDESKELILVETLKDDYVVWRPRLQEEKHSFEKIEKELGFEINQQIKDFLNTYWFRRLYGRMNVAEHEIRFALNEVIPGLLFDEELRYDFDRPGTHYLRDNHYYLMGTYCKVDGIDSYLVQVNNETGEVSAVEVGDRVSIKLADSIEELLMTMKGKWREI